MLLPVSIVLISILATEPLKQATYPMLGRNYCRTGLRQHPEGRLFDDAPPLAHGLGSQFPRLAHGMVKKLVRLVIVGKAFLFGIPDKVAAKLVADVR